MRGSFLRIRASSARRAHIGAKTVQIHRLGIPWRRAKKLARELFDRKAKDDRDSKKPKTETEK